jgi:hypothetical protein
MLDAEVGEPALQPKQDSEPERLQNQPRSPQRGESEGSREATKKDQPQRLEGIGEGKSSPQESSRLKPERETHILMRNTH